MRKSLLVILLLSSLTLSAQRADSVWNTRRGFIAQATTTFDMPMGDFADRFGGFYTVGGGLMYKTQKNIFFQAFCEFLISNRVKQDSMFRNISVGGYAVYDENGDLINPDIMLRGYNMGIGMGKTFLLSRAQSYNNGIQLMTSLSFMQHRINHSDPDRVLVQILGEYAKGYDYLSNGLCLNQSVNYIHFSRNTVTNFSVGLNFRWGFTKNRRSYNFDSGPPSHKLRNDMSLGIQLKWLIPLFKSLDREIYF